MNDHGLVVGSYVARDNSANIFTYNTSTGTWTNLNFPYPYDNLISVGISNSGVIALTAADNAGLILATPAN